MLESSVARLYIAVIVSEWDGLEGYQSIVMSLQGGWMQVY